MTQASATAACPLLVFCSLLSGKQPAPPPLTPLPSYVSPLPPTSILPSHHFSPLSPSVLPLHPFSFLSSTSTLSSHPFPPLSPLSWAREAGAGQSCPRWRSPLSSTQPCWSSSNPPLSALSSALPSVVSTLSPSVASTLLPSAISTPLPSIISTALSLQTPTALPATDDTTALSVAAGAGADTSNSTTGACVGRLTNLWRSKSDDAEVATVPRWSCPSS